MKSVFVTGSSNGIGSEIIRKYASKSYNVIISYYSDKESAYKLEKEIKDKYDVDTLVVKLDLSNEEDIKNVVNVIKDKFGSIDVLVNNASISNDSIFSMKNKKDFIKILDVNLVGTFLVSKYVSEIINDNGVIINISSTNGIDSYYVESLDYDASKSGVISLTHNLSNYFNGRIRVNCVCPGWIIDTKMNSNLDKEFIDKECKKILLNRFGRKEDVANLVYFLSSDEASYINDSIIKIDGGVRK